MFVFVLYAWERSLYTSSPAYSYSYPVSQSWGNSAINKILHIEVRYRLQSVFTSNLRMEKKNVISVIWTMVWFLVPDELIWVFLPLTLLTLRFSCTTVLRGLIQSDVKNKQTKKHPVQIKHLIDKRAQRRMGGGLVGADRPVTVTQITNLYKCSELKNIWKIGVKEEVPHLSAKCEAAVDAHWPKPKSRRLENHRLV